MIEPQIEALAEEFTQFWCDLFSHYPQFRLDYSYASLGTLDLILFPLRNKSKLEQRDYFLLSGAAAYLGKMAHDCWKKFAGPPQVRLTMEDSERPELFLSLSGGALLDSEEGIRVALCRSLETVLCRAENPMPCFSRFAVPLTREGPRVEYFAAGLLAAVAPSGRGEYLKIKVEALALNIDPAAEFLSQSLARHYEEVFPLDERFRNPELYRDHLIFPPLGYDEPFPAMRAVAGMIDYFRANSLDLQDIIEVSVELAKSPSERLAFPSFAIVAATCQNTVLDELRSLSEVFGFRAASLRPAVLLARKMLGFKESWEDYANDGDVEGAQLSLFTEYYLGLIPLCHPVIFNRVAQEPLRSFIQQLCWSRSDDVLKAYDARGIAPSVETADLTIQIAFLDLFRGDSESSKALLTKLESLSIDDPNILFALHELLGRVAESEGDFLVAQGYFERAITFESFDTLRYTSALAWLSGMAIRARDYEKASAYLERALSHDSLCVRARINYCLHLQSQQDIHGMEEELRKLVFLAPNSPRVFSLLKGFLLESRLAAMGSPLTVGREDVEEMPTVSSDTPDRISEELGGKGDKLDES
jgi:tetratricopeptide (TPR) repeat protein